MSPRPLQRLLVFLPPRSALLEGSARGVPSAATPVHYLGIDVSRRAIDPGQAPLSLLPKAAAVDLLFDASDVFTTLIEAPRMPEARLRQALPSLVEERLLSDASDCHLAYALAGVEGAQMRVAVAVVDQITLTRMLDAADEASVRPRSACSALYAVPPPAEGVLSVRFDHGRGTARTAQHAGVAFDLEDDPPAALIVAIRQVQATRLHVYGGEAPRLVGWAAQLGIEVVDVQRDFDPDSLSEAVNLLQGRFAPAGRFGMPSILALARSRYARPIVGWAALSLAIFIVGLNATRWRLEAQAGAVRASMQTAFRSTFPSEAFIEPLAQTRRHLRELRARAGQSSPDDFSVLNAQAAQLLANAPVGALSGLDYRDGTLTLKFKPGVSASPNLQDALRDHALQLGLLVRFESDGSARAVAVSP